jgi:hypothetical protein
MIWTKRGSRRNGNHIPRTVSMCHIIPRIFVSTEFCALAVASDSRSLLLEKSFFDQRMVLTGCAPFRRQFRDRFRHGLQAVVFSKKT